MTKPITSVGIMMLYEEGAFELTDPVSDYIPSFKDQTVYEAGPAAAPKVRPAQNPMQVRHLLNHTGGLTYGFFHVHVQDEIYRLNGFERGAPKGFNLEKAVDTWASMPLRFDPGTSWNYSVSTDVLGRLIEVLSGQSLDDYLQERIFDPLGMTDTSFRWDEKKHGDRLAALYLPDLKTHGLIRNDEGGDAVKKPLPYLSGGGGLISTTADYFAFVDMLRRGGERDGHRILGSRTLEYMTQNSLPDGQDLQEFGIPLSSETRYDGMGFGLGFSVLDDPVKYGTLSSPGEFAWGGAASTAFWVDPLEDITVIFMTQLMGSSTYPIRTQLKQLVYQALVD